MEMFQITNLIKENYELFIKKLDSSLFDIHPCLNCHHDMFICPNPKCVEDIGCRLCGADGWVCQRCDLSTYQKYKNLFDITSNLSLNPNKYDFSYISRLLDGEIKEIS